MKGRRAQPIVEYSPPPTTNRKKTLDDMTVCLDRANRMIGKYPAKMRPQLYAGLCASNGNGWQMIESFPWLAVRVYVMDNDQAESARRLVICGAKLRDIAAAVGVPMSFQRFFPKSTSRLMKVSDLLYQHPEIVSHHCPETYQRQGAWLGCVVTASESGDEDFAAWVAVHWESLDDSDYAHRTRLSVSNLNDWIRAGAIEEALGSIGTVDVETFHKAMMTTGSAELADTFTRWWQAHSNLVTAGRRFNKEMAPSTVLKLSEDWHERAAFSEVADVSFPEPWYDGGIVGDYRIEPIRTAAELVRYSHRLHNCGSQYVGQVSIGYCFLYVVFDIQEPETPRAMLDLRRNGCRNESRPSLEQLAGPCNEEVPEELEKAARYWFWVQQHPDQ